MLFLNTLLFIALASLYFSVKTNGVIKIVLAASLLAFAIGAYCLVNLPKNSNTPFLFSFFLCALFLYYPFISIAKSQHILSDKLLAILGIFASTFVIFNIINNYLFFIDDKTSGFINPAFFSTDTPCSKDALIYVSKKENEWHYRCPTDSGNGLYIVIGNAFNEPLIPWPNYYSGKSKDIERALHSRG